MLISRRAALLAGLGLVAAGCSGLPDGVPDTGTGRYVTGSFASRYRRTNVGWAISSPPGHPPGRSGRLPVLVFLHGRGGDHEYWHPRRGTDPAGMVVREFLPLLARQGLDVRRIGLMGNSMGGYGTLSQTVDGALDDAAVRRPA